MDMIVCGEQELEVSRHCFVFFRVLMQEFFEPQRQGGRESHRALFYYFKVFEPAHNQEWPESC